jgi:(2R)-sulfolactate sulfo-lyase subunit alpha
MPPMSNTTDFIVHDKQDNVGVVVVEKTPENHECTGWVMEDDSTIKIKANTSIPLGHKIALQDFKTGDTIIKYGYDIGKVVQDIKKGDHVHVHNVKTKKW